MSDIASVNRNGNNQGTDNSLEAIEKEFDVFHDKVISITSKTKDTNKLTDEEKSQLRGCYVRMVELAKQIAKRTTDDEKKTYFENLAVRLADSAVKYGSTVRAVVPTTTFDDVKGLKKAKELVESFTFMAENQDLVKYYNLQGGLGLLLYGAPGTGKTLFAEAVANKLGYVLFTVKPSEIFNSHVGESEKAVKKLFEEINSIEDGKTVLFIDECESLFSRRKNETDDYKAAVTTELLQGMNGFGQDKNQTKRVMIAATNMPWAIDPAYLRFKRFTYQVHIEPPDDEAKKAIIQSKLGSIPHPDISDDEILALTVKKDNEGKMRYFSGADLCGALEEVCRRTLEMVRKQSLETKEVVKLPIARQTIIDVFNEKTGSISEDTLALFKKFEETGEVGD